jgi:hypothetical protein
MRYVSLLFPTHNDYYRSQSSAGGRPSGTPSSRMPSATRVRGEKDAIVVFDARAETAKHELRVNGEASLDVDPAVDGPDRPRYGNSPIDC